MPAPDTRDDKQACPNCGFDAEFPFIHAVLMQLYIPVVAGDFRTCAPAMSNRYPVCRRCGYAIGLEDEDDELQQTALNFNAEE